MRTIELIDDYKDVAVYLFIIGLVYILWNIHQHYDRKRRNKTNETTKNYRTWN
jgi:hypothetical protein